MHGVAPYPLYWPLAQPRTEAHVFGIPGSTGVPTRERLVELYRQLARQHHPDLGGDAKRFAEITEAYNDALREIGG